MGDQNKAVNFIPSSQINTPDKMRNSLVSLNSKVNKEVENENGSSHNFKESYQEENNIQKNEEQKLQGDDSKQNNNNLINNNNKQFEVIITESDLVQIGSKRGDNFESFNDRIDFMNEGGQ